MIKHLYRCFIQKDLTNVSISENTAYEMIECLKEENISNEYLDNYM